LPSNDIERELIIDVLQSDLGNYLNTSHESYYHPSYIDLDTINSMESFVKRMKSNHEWGNYWLNYNITLTRDVNINVVFV